MMPSGTWVSVYAYCCASCWWRNQGGCVMQVALVPSSDPSSPSSGLCGNANGNPRDDIIPPGSTFPDPFYPEPVIFSASQVVYPSNSLINGHIPTFYPPCLTPALPRRLPAICDCSRPRATGCAALDASFSLMRPVPTFATMGTFKCPDTLNKRRRKREVSLDENDSTEVTDIVVNTDDIPPFTADAAPEQPLKGNTTTWPTPINNITEEMAHQICRAPIVESDVYKQCVNFTQEKLDSIVNSCVDDIQLTDQTDMALRGVLDRFHEACVLGIQQSDNVTQDDAVSSRNASLAANETSLFVNNTVASEVPLSSVTQQILNEIKQLICPGQPQCSGNGTCNVTTCVCNPGFIGVDCSINTDIPPVIYSSRYGDVCDVRNQSCARISLLADGFSLTSNFTCKVVDAVEAGNTFYTAPSLISRLEVQCQLPVSPIDLQSTKPTYEWIVQISNDNETYSNSIYLFVFDSKCMSCPTKDSLNCTQLNATCLIDGNCYSPDEVDPTDARRSCDPYMNSTDWTYTETTVVTVAPTTASITTTPRTLSTLTSATRALTTSSVTSTSRTTTTSKSKIQKQRNKKREQRRLQRILKHWLRAKRRQVQAKKQKKPANRGRNTVQQRKQRRRR